MVCGLDSATSTYSCIWCKCPKDQRSDMDKTWFLIESQNEASKSKLLKLNRHKFNYSNKPLFLFIPIKRVIIDNLHLFLRISDVSINLLIRDLQQCDAFKNTIEY